MENLAICDVENIAELIHSLKRSTNLTSFTFLSSKTSIPCDIFCGVLANLTYFELMSSNLINLTNSQFSLPKLKHLSFKSSNLSDEQMHWIDKLINSAINLTSLSLTMNAKNLSTITYHNSQLETLQINCLMSSGAYSGMYKIFENQEKLKSLKLSSLFINEIEIGRILEKFRELQHLEVNEMYGTVYWLVTSPKLKTFRMTSSGVGTLHLTTENLESLEIINCVALSMLQITGETKLSDIKVKPFNEHLTIDASVPGLTKLLQTRVKNKT